MTNRLSKTKVLLIIAAVILVLLLAALWLYSPSQLSFSYSYTDRAEEGIWNGVDSSDWMKNIDGTLYLSDISMPGSHNSCTQYVELPLVGCCQTTSVSNQLLDGIRVLDIRLNTSPDGDGTYSLSLSHGFLNCKTASFLMSDNLSFASVLQECYSFLDEHPSETILMMVKHEHGDGFSQAIEDAVNECIGTDTAYWYTENRLPTLDEVRGKIVLARRYGAVADSSLSGLDFYWEDQGGSEIYAEPFTTTEASGGFSLRVQDRYEYDAKAKWSAVSYTMENMPEEEQTIVLNYLSTKGSGSFGIPKHYASAMNSWFMEKDLRSDNNYGCVLFDFSDKALARHVFASNTYVPLT